MHVIVLLLEPVRPQQNRHPCEGDRHALRSYFCWLPPQTLRQGFPHALRWPMLVQPTRRAYARSKGDGGASSQPPGTAATAAAPASVATSREVAGRSMRGRPAVAYVNGPASASGKRAIPNEEYVTMCV